MKRSDINKEIVQAIEFFKAHQFHLPSFAFWSGSEFESLDQSYQQIIDNKLGWDVTDFGSDNFDEEGLLLFTLRNGNYNNHDSKKYAEKIMIVKENQVTPLHYHWQKKEDIINRGGGVLVIKLYKADSHDSLSEEAFTVHSDGKEIQCEAGDEITLSPGESVTLLPKVYHSFWGKSGTGSVLVGEVSETNDDTSDNRFFSEVPRYPSIIEDEEPVHLLVSDYD